MIEIYAAEPLRRRECLYYLALGYYKLGNWDHAKRFNGQDLLPAAFCIASVRAAFSELTSDHVNSTTDLLLSKEPTNMQAQSLNSLIEAGVAKGMRGFLPPFLHSDADSDTSFLCSQRVTSVWPSREESLLSLVFSRRASSGRPEIKSSRCFYRRLTVCFLTTLCHCLTPSMYLLSPLL